MLFYVPILCYGNLTNWNFYFYMNKSCNEKHIHEHVYDYFMCPIDDILSIDNIDFDNHLGQIYILISLRSKTQWRATRLLPTCICSYRSGGMANFALPLPQTGRFQFPYHKHSVYVQQYTSSSAYGVLIAQFIPYAMAWSSYECYAMRFFNKPIGHGYVKEHLKSTLI